MTSQATRITDGYGNGWALGYSGYVIGQKLLTLDPSLSFRGTVEPPQRPERRSLHGIIPKRFVVC